MQAAQRDDCAAITCSKSTSVTLSGNTDYVHKFAKILYFTESQREQTESVQTPHVAGKNYYFDEHSKTISVNSGQKRSCDCSGCLRKDCGSCKFCLDKPKFGGPGKKKKRCIKRVCCDISTGIIYNRIVTITVTFIINAGVSKKTKKFPPACYSTLQVYQVRTLHSYRVLITSCKQKVSIVEHKPCSSNETEAMYYSIQIRHKSCFTPFYCSKK